MKQRRETRQRQLILKAVRARRDHPSADQIYLDVREIDSRISRGTVYRNLNCLADDREITHVRVPGADRYDFRTTLHYHLICMECGSVIDMPFAYQTELDKLAEERTGFSINRHRTVYEGICPVCQHLKNKETI